MFDKIVVGDDGRDGGRDAIALARTLAPRAELVLVGVYAYDTRPSRAALAGYGDLLHEDTVAALERSRSEHDLPGARIVAIADLSPARALHRVAEDEHADLIVVGSARLGKVGRALLGDVARATLHDAPCPVVVAPRDGAARPPRTIGVAFDGSPEAQHALAVAAEVARLHGAHLVARRVVNYELLPLAGLGYVVDVAELREGMLKNAQRLVTEAVAELGLEGAEASAVLGTTPFGLQALAETVDLVVCGSRGRAGLRRVLLGSSADYLIHHAPCPVLVIPPSADRAVQTEVAATASRATA